MRRLIVCCAAVLAIGIQPPAARAVDQTGSGGVQNSAVFAQVQYGQPPVRGGTDSNGCSWIPAALTSTTAGSVPDTKIVNGTTYRQFLKVCPTFIQGYWVPQVPATTLSLASAARIQQQLPTPTLRTAPTTSQGIVKVGMWFWTDPTTYRPISVTAWIPTPTGTAWARTTATPIALRYTPGEPDGHPTQCNGPGPAWQPHDGDDLPSPCMYTYRHSSSISPTGTFTATLSTIWRITWTSNITRGGTLPDLITSTTTTIKVREIQALVVG